MNQAMAIDTKRCCACKRDLPLTEFWKNAHYPDGLQKACRLCKHMEKKKLDSETRVRLRTMRRKIDEEMLVQGPWHTEDIDENCCSICGSKLHNLNRVIEVRPTGINHRLQRWAYCKKCWKGMIQLRKESDSRLNRVNWTRRFLVKC